MPAVLSHTEPAPTPSAGLTRRSFLKWSGAVAGTGALVSVAGDVASPVRAVEGRADADRTVWSSCNVNCGSRCPLRLQVKDGVVVRVLPDNTGDDEVGTQQIRACVRGRTIRKRIYNPDRLKTPMRRKPGTPRGGGQWEEISWDEAFQTIADKLTALIAEYGNECVYIQYGTGVIGANIATSWPPRATAVARLMNCIGGSLDQYNDYSAGNIEAAVDFQHGYWHGSNSNDDLKNSRLVVMFGNNPHETRMSGGGETFVTQQVKRASGHRVIVIDPRYSETAMNLADEWVPIRPGTDAALVAAFAHVMITEDLLDRDFLDTYCSGFDEAHMPPGMPPNLSYESYVLGRGADGVEKTPEWAARITGIPAPTIVRLAREIATTKPCSVNQGWGIQRHSNGENQARAPMTLAGSAPTRRLSRSRTHAGSASGGRHVDGGTRGRPDRAGRRRPPGARPPGAGCLPPACPASRPAAAPPHGHAGPASGGPVAAPTVRCRSPGAGGPGTGDRPLRRAGAWRAAEGRGVRRLRRVCPGVPRGGSHTDGRHTGGRGTGPRGSGAPGQSGTVQRLRHLRGSL